MGRKRVLRVGIDDAPPVPMQAGDPASGTFRGYEVDLLDLLAERLGYAIEYRRAWWSCITQELIAGHLDLICSAATVTTERKTEVSFCTPHLRLQLALVTRQNSPEPVAGTPSRFGVRRGTTAETFLHEGLGGQAALWSESNEELYNALATGELDAVIDDSPIALHFASSVPGLSYRMAYDNTESEYAIMVAKGNERLRSEIDACLSTLKDQGALARLRKLWFGTAADVVA